MKRDFAVQILFCQHPLDRGEVDPDFERERAAADAAGLGWALLDFEALVGGDAAGAVRRVPAGKTMYRGWMLRVEQYARLCEALAARGAMLVNDVDAYRFTHWLPASLPAIGDVTPRTVWTRDVSQAVDVLRDFAGAPVILKDFVKSRKHEWDEACFIPRSDDADAVRRTVARFLELQAEDFTEGLVFREFVRLKIIGTHPQSGMPLGRESRLFFFEGRILARFDYWRGNAEAAPLPEPIAQAAARVPSAFFTMDVACLEDGTWTVMELGDGQVAGLPEAADVTAFYRGVKR